MFCPSQLIFCCKHSVLKFTLALRSPAFVGQIRQGLTKCPLTEGYILPLTQRYKDGQTILFYQVEGYTKKVVNSVVCLGGYFTVGP